MSKIVIGTEPSGKQLRLDVDLLIPSRLLIQANSGGGKSWLLRRLAEQFYGRVQTIIIDPEGEFFTLREKYGYVLVGEGGETPCDVRSAAMLAERFLELKASAVCDLYEAFRSRPMERRQWVRYFLNALIDAPRKLWHPLIVIVDEAHKFCPQETPKSGNQLDREIIGGCKDAMIALSTTGRKRGFCAIWATQRLAKLDKDASAELFNRLVGMTIEDVDVDRAADLMSVSKDQKQEFRHSLRTLNPGQFYAFGRAITIERTLVNVGDVETRHPESGKQAAGSTAPPMPDEVKKFLPQLSDLPKEAEQKVRTVAELEKKVRELTIELKKRPAIAAAAPAGKPDPAQARTIHQLQTSANRLAKVLKSIREFKFAIDAAAIAQTIEQGFKRSAIGIERLQREADQVLAQLGFQNPSGEPIAISAPSIPAPRAASSSIAIAPPRIREPRSSADNGDLRLGRIHAEIAGILAGHHPQPMKVGILATMVGRTPGGSFSARLSELRSAGLLADPGAGLVGATEKCAAEYAGTFQAPQSTEEVLRLWTPKMGEVHRQILSVLVDLGGEPIAIDELAQRVGRTPGGSFSARLSEVRSSGLIVDAGRGRVAANKEALFLNGEAA
jgi:uncharacterized protein